MKDSTSIIACIAGLSGGGVAAGVLYRLLERLRQGGVIARFVARFWIIGFFYFAFGVVMVLIAGPYVFAGPTRYGGYISTPTTFRETLGSAIGLGLVGAILWPIVGKARQTHIQK